MVAMSAVLVVLAGQVQRAVENPGSLHVPWVELVPHHTQHLLIRPVTGNVG